MKGSFIYRGKKGTFIASNVLKKAHRGHYKNDIIELSVVSLSENFVKTFTPYETEILITALSVALLDYDSARKRIKK